MHDEHSHGHNHDHGHIHNGENTVVHELLCHLPYAIYSVAFSLIMLSIYSVFSIGLYPVIVNKGRKALFHSFHFMHIVFAATGTIITFRRFSKKYFFRINSVLQEQFSVWTTKQNSKKNLLNLKVTYI